MDRRIDDASRLSARMEPETWDAERLTVEMVWTAGAPVPRRDRRTGQRYLEVLSTDPGDVRLDRLRNGAPFLLDHNGWSVSRVAGRVLSADETTALVQFSQRDELAGVRQDVADGILHKVSVGYDPGETFDEVHGDDARAYNERANTSDLPVRIFRGWEPHELSLVAIAADDNAGLRSHIPQEPETRADDTEEPIMADTQAPEAPAVNETEIRAAERQRINDSLDAVRKGRSLGLDAKALDALEAEVRSTEITADAVRARLLTLDAEKVDEAPVSGRHGAELVADASDKLRSAVSDAIAHRMGGKVDLAASGAREFRGRTLIEIGEEVIRANGGQVGSGMTRSERARAVLQFRSGMHSTSDFSHVLLDALNKQLLELDPEASHTTWMQIARSTTVRDFRTKYAVKMDAFADYKSLPEGGTIEYSSASDDRESYAISRYGAGFLLTFEAMVNDDLDAFSRFVPELRRGSNRKRNETVIGLLTANGNLRNGRAIFNTTDGTLDSSGAAPSQTTIYDAVHAMRSHTKTVGTGTKRLGIQPWAVLAPWALEETIETLYATFTNPSASDSVSTTPTILGLGRIYDWDLDDASETEWYVLANPAVYPGVEYAELEGYGGLSVFQDETVPAYQGAGFGAVDHFGAGVIERRAMYKNPGAGA